MRGTLLLHTWCVSCTLTLVVLLGSHSGFGQPTGTTEECRLSAIHGDHPFPVERLNAHDRCRVERIVDHAATTGVVGPTPVPMAPALYRYLLDHPVVASALVRHLDLAPYTITREAPGRYWVDDGTGAQGQLEVLYKDDEAGIYLLDGFYDQGWLPRITGKLAFFLRFHPTPDERGGVETVTVSYVQLDRTMLHWMLTLLSPLVEPAVTHRISGLFRAAETLGARLMQEPARFIRELPAIPSIEPEARRQLGRVLERVSHDDNDISTTASGPS